MPLTAATERDFTVNISCWRSGTRSGYHYGFVAGGERSPIGRTKTLPERTDRLRVASVSCSNYPAGYFNVYRCIANRPDLDAVIHLGDYIYEFANGRYGDGSASGRVPLRAGEASTLEFYRARYATYRSPTSTFRQSTRAIRLSPSGTITSPPTMRGRAARRS